MTSLLELVESLEIGLIDPKAGPQKDSIKTLLDGLKMMDINTVDANEIAPLLEFLVSRLAIADPEVTSHILDGFLWLARSVQRDGRRLLTPAHAAYICQKGLFGHLNIQSLSKSNRLRSFKLLHVLLHGPQLTDLKQMNSDFIFAYVQAIDGEKDPENLILIFELNLIVMENFSPERIAEDFFESMAVYFPIDFFPPPGSEFNGITRVRLAELLHRCLFCSRTFSSPFLLPLLCEKADSEWPQAQLDSLTLLADCLHGHLHSSTLVSMSTRGPSVPLRHLSCFLVLILPILSKMANRPLSKEMDSSVLACLSGLVHSYSSQGADVVQLQDFVSVLLKSFGIPVDVDSAESNNGFKDPPDLPLDRILVCLSETLRASRTNSVLAEILLDRLIPYFCAPLCRTHEATQHLHEELTTLKLWKPSFTVCCSLLDAVTSPLSYADPCLHVSWDSNLKLVHSYLSYLLSRLYQWLVVDNTTISESNCPVELPRLSDLILTLIGLSVRLHVFLRRLTDRINSNELAQLSELLSYLVRHFAVIFPAPLPDCKPSTRDELCATVTRMYSTACLPAMDTLSESLFSLLQMTDEATEQAGIVLEILQRAALTQSSVLERLLTFLINAARSATENSSTTPLINFTHVFHFLAVSSLDMAAAESASLIGHLQHVVIAQSDVVAAILRIQLPTVYPLSSLDQLNSAFRILSALSESGQQCELLHSWESQLLACRACGPLLLAVWCGIVCGLRPQVVSLRNPVGLLAGLMECADKIGTATDSLRPSLSMFVAQAYGSVLNKCPEPLSQDVFTAVSGTADQLSNLYTATDDRHGFFVDWLLSCLHGTLSHPGPSRLTLTNQLMAFVLQSSQICLRNVPSSHPSCLTEANINSVINCFLSHVVRLGQPVPVGSPASTICHWKTTPLYSQKLYHLVVLPLASKVDSLIPPPGSNVPSFEEANLKDAYLSSFLEMCSSLPDELLTGQLKKLLRYCLMAISNSAHKTTQFQGIRLLCHLVKRVASQSNPWPEHLTVSDLDDLFTTLPRMASSTAFPTHTDVSGNVGLAEAAAMKSSAKLRLSIARCLSILVHLPSSVTSRHRDTEVLPLLSRMVDDPCRYVRLEAARARNAWLLLT